MTGYIKKFRDSVPTAGIILIGLGIFLLYENAVGAIASMTHDGALRTLPSILLYVSHLVRAYAEADHARVLQHAFERALVSIWPVMLVVVGSILARIP